tara:strand:- start:1574 stop:2437 length:864 start_codon:yes stop_codon:yes gene_type:complete
MKWKQGWGEYTDIKYLDCWRETKSFCAVMNYSQFIERLENTPNQKEREKLIEFFYYSYRVYSDTLIKLHKNHIPLNPKICIQTQESYDFYMETLLWLLNQLKMGVEPAWFITFHYEHPSEKVKKLKETSFTEGWRDRIFFKDLCSLHYYKYWVNRRNDEDQVYEDTSQIRNVLLRYLYGIKRLNRTDKKEFPNIFFFHEKGKTKLQYHTHLLIPKKNLNPDFNNQKDLSWLFNDFIRHKRKCFSKWKHIDVRPVNDKEGLIGYLNKETNPNHISFDFFNSIPLKTNA